MRVGIDARLLTGRNTGDRTYWLGLVKGLAALPDINEYILYCRETPAFDQMPMLDGRFTTRIVPSRHDRIWSAVSFPLALRKDRVDVAHVQYTVPPFMPAPTVTTIHDISFKLLPHLFTAKDRAILGGTIPSSIARAAAVIGVSQNTRDAILAEYPGTPPEKVHAILNGVDPVFRPIADTERDSVRAHLKDAYGIDRPYVLCLGLLQPRKNVPFLIKAFARARREASLPHVLVVAGRSGWMAAETEAAISSAGGDVLFTGYIPDEDLPRLYGAADALAYPSLYEGFGLPAAEAMACGCPVIVSNTSSLPEVVGDAGILASPTDTDAWVAALTSLLTDSAMRDDLHTKGIERAKLFTWEKMATETLAVYRAAAVR
ncbi:MAG TPA: glycosyltransferase family 1 protein [Capsulimonadaceae bacterium]|jgi:glycosyltransferase involved in cell wall biosynthesis